MKTQAQLEAMTNEELIAEMDATRDALNQKTAFVDGASEIAAALADAFEGDDEAQHILASAREEKSALADYLLTISFVAEKVNRIKTMCVYAEDWNKHHDSYNEWLEETASKIEAPRFQVVDEDGSNPRYVTTEEGVEGLKFALCFANKVRVYRLPDDITIADALTTLCPFDWFDEELTRRTNDFDFDGMEV